MPQRVLGGAGSLVLRGAAEAPRGALPDAGGAPVDRVQRLRAAGGRAALRGRHRADDPGGRGARGRAQGTRQGGGVPRGASGGRGAGGAPRRRAGAIDAGGLAERPRRERVAAGSVRAAGGLRGCLGCARLASTSGGRAGGGPQWRWHPGGLPGLAPGAPGGPRAELPLPAPPRGRAGDPDAADPDPVLASGGDPRRFLLGPRPGGARGDLPGCAHRLRGMPRGARISGTRVP